MLTSVLSGRLLTRGEAARYLTIGERTLYNLVQRGAIATIRPSPRSIRFRVEDLAAFAESRRTAPLNESQKATGAAE